MRTLTGHALLQERARKGTRGESELLRECADGSRTQWPGVRLPEVYYDPRTLSSDAATRAAWHAKCLLIDDKVALVTSANFTEWAHQRNVEAGVLVRSPHFTSQLRPRKSREACTGVVKWPDHNRAPAPGAGRDESCTIAARSAGGRPRRGALESSIPTVRRCAAWGSRRGIGGGPA